MKHINLKRVIVVAVGAALIVLAPVEAGINPQQAVVAKAVEKTPVAELAAKASALVSNARAEDREDVAVAAVQAIVSKHPAVAVPVVAAIAKAAPEVAAKIAAKAAQLSPTQAVSIARVAALNAPKYAAQIAAAVARVAPKSAAAVAEMVMFVVPAAATQVADAVSAAVPEAQAAIQPIRRTNIGVAGGGDDVNVEQTGREINSASIPFGQRNRPHNSGGEEVAGFDYSRP